jgi:7,8-dihydropterin-6-yl-methyl-4-(beta-D-ribofuranosyl)aminobenzene 5'-phosphate synthase
MLEKLIVRILICDRSRYINDLWSQFGLSILVDCYYQKNIKKRILFDTGWSLEPLLHNMEELNINPESIDMLVLSHCHYDHTGGLEGILELLDDFMLIAHMDITRPVYSDEPDLHYIGLKPELIDILAPERKILIDNPLQILPQIWVSGTIKRQTSFEKPEKSVYILENGNLVPDPERDDMAIYIDTGKEGIIVITGCGHAGVINTIYHGQSIIGNNRIKALIGGFHLIDLESEVRNKTISKLTEFEIEHIWSGHCTGWDAERMLEDNFKEKHTRFFTGDEISIDCKY